MSYAVISALGRRYTPRPPHIPEANPDILELGPVVYWPMTNGTAVDLSGHGLDGTINGTIAGSSAAGIDLGGTADISLAHNSTVFETDPAPTTVDQDSYSEVGVSGRFTVNTLSNNTALISKCDDTTAFALGWYAEAMADGSVRCHFVSHRLNDLVIDAPAGTISEGVEFVLHMGLGYDGAWAAINGRMLWSGYKCPLHWYGDDHRVRDIAATGRNHNGSRKVNQSAVRIGKIGSSGDRGDITVREVALFYFDATASQLTLADVQTIAGTSGTALEHPVWGASTQSVANGASAATVQSAIDAATGVGGTVRLAASGTYSWTTDVTLKNNVMLDLNGATVTTTAQVIMGANNSGTFTSITDDGGNVAQGATSIVGASVAAGLNVGDALIMLNNNFVDAKFGGTELTERESEVVIVKSKAGSTVNFDRPTVHAYTSASRAAAPFDALWKWVPHRDMALVNGTIQKAGDRPLMFFGGYRCMVADLFVHQTATTNDLEGAEQYDMIDLWSPGGYRLRNMANEGAAAGHAYGHRVIGWARGCVFHSAEFYQGGYISGSTIGGWHAISHASANRIGAVDSQGIAVECEYIACVADTADQRAVFDCHHTSTAIRWIDCGILRTATGVAGTFGDPGGGGILLDGYRHEILRFTVDGNTKWDHFSGQEGQCECYVRDLEQVHPTITAHWFTNKPYVDSTYVNMSRVNTSAPNNTPATVSDGCVFVNVDDPHPTG